MRSAVYGHPPNELADLPADAVQVSPLIPGSARLEDVPDGTLERAVVLAPPGTVDRRYTLALALRALAPDGSLVAMAPKEKGGSQLAKELTGFGCEVSEEARRHHRICTIRRPEILAGVETAIADGAPCHVDNLALCTQPGIFSWNRLDPGSALLMQHLPTLSGRGADFGCGLGILALAVLRSAAVTAMTLIDIDRRAVAMAARNVSDPRAATLWADLRKPRPDLSRLDFVVMNPPFHDGGAEDQVLGRTFVGRASEALRPGGSLWLTANAHLPYEAALGAAFRSVRPIASVGGFKVFEARK